MSLGPLMIPLGNTEEAGWWAVAAPTLVSIIAGTVEVMKGVLVGASALTANYKVLVSTTSFDRVA